MLRIKPRWFVRRVLGTALIGAIDETELGINGLIAVTLHATGLIISHFRLVYGVDGVNMILEMTDCQDI